MTTNPPEGTPDPGAYPPPDSPTPPQTPPAYQAPPPGYGQTPPVYGQPVYAAPLSPSDERLWATLAHVGGIVLGFIAPLVVWLVFRERSGFVNDQAKEALNFQILILIAYIVGGILTVVLIGGLILALAWLATIIFGIMGAVAANKGELYRYPFNWRIIK
ncbi:hypothetical protein CELL_02985 [Cellulomonas sp. T2.31MG-18]|uniref:DUF4870 domain-containing protein n=1 Tax=unclassified Cellulomonas TaxID=2620175 RepID=UPI0030816448|nr:membrane protein [Cellulomonas sp. NTE-D12]